MERTAEGAQWHELLHTHLGTKPPLVCSFHGIVSLYSPAWDYVAQVGIELVILQLQQGLLYPVVPYSQATCLVTVMHEGH